LKQNGGALINKILKSRDPSDSNVINCRIGLTNDDDVNTRLSGIQNSIANAFLSSSSKRKRRGYIQILHFKKD
jgi:hypothetical protein